MILRLGMFGMMALCVFAPPAGAEPQGQTFGGYKCTMNCSGHIAGYKWAERHNITDKVQCGEILLSSPERTSFYEGCVTYVEHPKHGPHPDADEN